MDAQVRSASMGTFAVPHSSLRVSGQPYSFEMAFCFYDRHTTKKHYPCNPILERGSVLERVLKPRAGIQIGSYVEDEGKALFNLTKEKGMEGIIAKRKTVFTGRENEPQSG
jgi:bifunctional non-homologous end joining protein LigD